MENSNEVKNVVVRNIEVKNVVEKNLDSKKDKKEKKAESKKEVETTSINLEYVLKSLNKNLLVSVSGMSKETVYRNEIFKDCITDRDKKTIRRKLRNILDNFASSFIRYYEINDKNKINALKKEFDYYYKSVYRINDYSINSLISNNTDINKKSIIDKMLQIIKNEK